MKPENFQLLICLSDMESRKMANSATEIEPQTFSLWHVMHKLAALKVYSITSRLIAVFAETDYPQVPAYILKVSRLSFRLCPLFCASFS